MRGATLMRQSYRPLVIDALGLGQMWALPSKGGFTVDQLIGQVSQRAGISPDQARTAVQTVAEFVKQRLPGPMASQVDGILAGQSTGNTPNMGNLGGQAKQTMGDVDDTLGGMRP
jgi:hypothetical protein